MEQVTVTWLLKQITGAAPWLGFEEKGPAVSMFCRGCNEFETFSSQLLASAARYANGGVAQMYEYTSGVSVNFRGVPSLYKHLRCGETPRRFSVPESFNPLTGQVTIRPRYTFGLTGINTFPENTPASRLASQSGRPVSLLTSPRDK